MRVKADLTPKNASPGLSFDQYQQKGTENNAKYIHFQLMKSKARKV